MASDERGPGNGRPEAPAHSQGPETEAGQSGTKSAQDTSPRPSESSPTESASENKPEQSAASQTSKAEERQPRRELPSSRNRWAVGAGILTLVVLIVMAVVVYEFVLPRTGEPEPTASASQNMPTEAMFQDNVPEAAGTSDGINEWRAARSDHKLIAYAIARCLKIDIGTMSPDEFSMFMLDLRPNG